MGSDDHGTAAGHLLSGVASARLHDLDPEAYFRDIFRVIAHWPKDRYLELAPKYWAATGPGSTPSSWTPSSGTSRFPRHSRFRNSR